MIPQGPWFIDDFLTWTVDIHRFDLGGATDGDADPTWRLYEDETATPILTGTMAKLDDAGTTGFYSERIQLTAAAGFEAGKTYTIRIAATVNGVAAALSGGFKVIAGLATAAALATVDAVVDAIQAKTDNLPSDPADQSLIIAATDAIRSDIAGLNDISVAEVLTTQMPESYAANGVAPTLAQALFAIHQYLMEFDISGTSYTVKQLGGSNAFVVTLNSATNPSAAARS